MNFGATLRYNRAWPGATIRLCRAEATILLESSWE